MKQHLEPELQRLLGLPWTIISETTPEGDLLLRVKEIPSAVGSGDTEAAAIADLREALTESLRAHLHFGDPVPVILTPERIQRADAVRAKLDELGITSADITDAVAWAKRDAAK
jgi:predicted RNase H-like HicB family nuclease